jgi:hypothetical protein
MGDIADWVTDNGELDYLENGVTCRYCKEDGFWWVNVGTKRKPVWRLSDGENLHQCPARLTKAQGEAGE